MPATSSAAPTVGDLGERALIARIHERVPLPDASVVIGIGDDAAVVVPDRNALAVLTTDAQVEGVHFTRHSVPAHDIGYRALAVNLSDVAAMGATPRHALLSLVIPPSCALADLDALVDGLLELAAAARVSLVGGNLARSPGPLIVDITVMGAVHPRRILRRDGAREGDELWVSGTIGAAAAGLAYLSAASPGELERAPSCVAEAVARFRRPQPRLRLGRIASRTGASRAAIDLSDGLAEAVRQLCEASRVGGWIDADRIPVDDGARAWAERAGTDAVAFALAGGEDYELLFAVGTRSRKRFEAAARQAGTRVTRIGALTREPAVVLRSGGAETALPAGFAHFR